MIMAHEQVYWIPGMTLEALEKICILKAYSFYKNNKTITANSLGIAIRTLDTKLEKYILDEKNEKIRKENESIKHAEFLARQRGNPRRDDGLPYFPYSPDLKPDSLERHFPGPGMPSGTCMESLANASQEQAMSLSERKEVQGVSSKSSSKGSQRK
jgi:hypothetical protein